MSLELQREPGTIPLLEELLPMLELHWAEIAVYQDIPLDPDVETYAALEAQGQLRIYTAREAGALRGYAVFFVRPNLHYKGSKQAWQDVFYIDPRERFRGGFMLVRYCEAALRAEGVQVVYHHAKLINGFGQLLKTMKYQLVDEIYAKRLI